MNFSLTGKAALVTGGGRGIGRAIAIALAGEGVDVAIANRNAYDETVEELEATGSRAFGIRADVSQEDQAVGMVKQVIETFGRIDIYVNNAAVYCYEPVTKITTAQWLKTINTNLTGAVCACREVARHMISRREGTIVIVSSTIQYMPAYKEAAYRSSKTGLQAYAETLALELAPFGIRVNTVSPGIIYIGQKNVDEVLADPQRKKEFLVNIPIGRIGLPEEVAPAVLFLASDGARYLTGSNIVVDGGFTLRPLVLITQEEIEEMNL